MAGIPKSVQTLKINTCGQRNPWVDNLHPVVVSR